MLGPWKGDASVNFTPRDNFGATSYACDQNWLVQSQNGGEFSGAVDSNGQGSNSDKFCALRSGTFTATMTAAGAITSARLELGASTCTHVSGDGTFTGSFTAPTSFTIRMSDVWNCPDPRGDLHLSDRTITIRVTKR